MVKLNARVGDVPTDEKKAVEQYLTDKLIIQFTSDSGRTDTHVNQITFGADDLIFFLNNTFSINDGKILRSYSLAHNTLITKSINAKYQTGEFIKFYQLPALVSYGLLQNLDFFLDWCLNLPTRLSTTNGITKYIADHNYADYLQYLTDYVNESTTDIKQPIEITIDKFNNLVQETIHHCVKKVAAPDFTAYLQAHPYFVSGGGGSGTDYISIPLLAYDEDATRTDSDFAATEFINDALDRHSKTFNDAALASKLADTMDSGKGYCQQVVTRIFNAAEIERYNTKLGWKDPSFQSYGAPGQQLPFVVIECITPAEKANALTLLNKQALKFFDHTSILAGLPSVLDLQDADFDIDDPAKGRKIFKLKLYTAVQRTSDLTSYALALSAPLSPAANAVEECYEALNARKQLEKEKSVVALKVYKQSIIKLLTYDAAAAAKYSQVVGQFKKILDECQPPFSWDVFVLVVFVTLMLAVVFGFLGRLFFMRRTPHPKTVESEEPVVQQVDE